MKNIILIDTDGEQLISSTDDGTNSLYINGDEIDSSEWVGSGNYTATIAGHAITIAKVSANTGNIIINKINDYNYELSQTRYMPPGLLDAIYPVGSIYMSVNAVDPGVLFGGTWEPIEDRFLLAAGDTYDNGATGGAATVKLKAAESGNQAQTITSDGMSANESHTHGTGNGTHFMYYDSDVSGVNQGRRAVGSGGSYYAWTTAKTAGLLASTATASKSLAHTHKVTVAAKDAANAHNNMPPYLVVNMWQRTG